MIWQAEIACPISTEAHEIRSRTAVARDNAANAPP